MANLGALMADKVQRGQWRDSGGCEGVLFAPEGDDASSQLYMYTYHGIAVIHHVLEPQLQAACLAIV